MEGREGRGGLGSGRRGVFGLPRRLHVPCRVSHGCRRGGVDRIIDGETGTDSGGSPTVEESQDLPRSERCGVPEASRHWTDPRAEGRSTKGRVVGQSRSDSVGVLWILPRRGQVAVVVPSVGPVLGHHCTSE